MASVQRGIGGDGVGADRVCCGGVIIMETSSMQKESANAEGVSHLVFILSRRCVGRRRGRIVRPI